jgi:hypothetical protein
MAIAGLEVEDDALNGRVSVLSGLGKAWLPNPTKVIQQSLWSMFWASIKRKLGL